MKRIRRLLRLSVLTVALCGAVVGMLPGCSPVPTPPEAGLGPTAMTHTSRFHEAIPYAAGRALDVHAPFPEAGSTPAAAPVVVLLHGCCGDRSDLTKLSEALAAAQLVVFNVDWAGLDADASFPDTYEDVACAIGFARQHARDFGGDPKRVIVAGWSDGAMAAAAVAGAPGRLDAGGCLADVAPVAGTVAPTAVVGIGGFYGWTVPVADTYVTSRAIRLFGGGPEEAGERWSAATPYTSLRSAPPTLLLVGTTDPLVADARRYAEALRDAGRPVRVVAIPPDGDQTLISPRTTEGRRVVTEIAALAHDPANQPATSHSR